MAALAVAAAASAFGAGSSSTGRSSTSARATTSKAPARERVNPVLVRRLRRTVWRWQAVTGVRRALPAPPLHTQRALRYWRRQARVMRRLAAHPPHLQGWLCIHRFEGSWHDGGDPYWGGLQMDRGFMRIYAPRVLLRRGWADRWTPLEQMWVAERAHRSGRGYWPWAATARSCGLV
jgi:hypothetical protein